MVLPLFGKVDMETGCNVEISAFEQAFLKKKCVGAFKRVGAATKDDVTCACLQDAQVMQSISDGDKEVVLLHHAIKKANNNAFHYLNHVGTMLNIFR
jgi:hypothetical protein